MNQVRVERGATDTSHKRDAEESRQKALARKETQHKHAVNENREAMVHKVIVSGASTVVNGYIEGGWTSDGVIGTVKENEKHVKKAVLRIKPVKPQITGIAKHNSPKKSRNEHGTEKHPEHPAVLLKKPATEPRRNGVAKEKARQRPRRFIQFHAQIRGDGPREREMHEQAPPRMEHFR